MSFPSIPSRPRPTDSGGGGLVSSRVKAFANVASNLSSASQKLPPSLPIKPKHVGQAFSYISANPPTSKQIHQMARTFEFIHQTQSALDGHSARSNGPVLRVADSENKAIKSVPKPPPPLPKRTNVQPSPSTISAVANAVKNSANDFSVKDIKSKFETAISTGDWKSNQALAPAPRPSQRSRPISEHLHPSTIENIGALGDDFNNNNAAKVKSLRAELESKLTIRSPNSVPPQFPNPTRTSAMDIHSGAGADHSNAIDYQQYPMGNQGARDRDHLPISMSYTDGFNYSKQPACYDFDDRPVLPTLSAKSKPPPRPPPCSLPSRDSPQPGEASRQHVAQQFLDDGAKLGTGGGYLDGHGEISRTPSPQEAYAVVAYDFYGEQSDELTSKRGDHLILKHEVDDEWFYAYNTRTSRTGIIPKGFVEVKVPLPAMRHANPQSDEDSGIESATDGPRCYTLHDFVSNIAGDLTFLKGEVIKLISRVNDEWLEGESHDGRRGIFPVTFVEIIEDLPTSSPGYESLSPPSGFRQEDSGIVTTLYDFHGENQGDLSFMAGEQISVKALVNADWLYGIALHSNQSGIFPASFVDRIPSHLPFFDPQ